MSTRFPELQRRQQRGSKPRCHLLTDGPPDDVAARLTALAAPFAEVRRTDRWMPQGFADVEEAQLHTATRLIPAEVCAVLRDWWLAPESVRAMTPNFDIASTCVIGGVSGLLLVEAKAYDQELLEAAAGRLIGPNDSIDRRASHDQIGRAIEEARAGLASSTGEAWGISRDSRYQLSNRFAWSWKLAMLGIPVVLIYLGFLRATDMADKGRPLESAGDWEALVLAHSAGVVPERAWTTPIAVGPATIVAAIRSLLLPQTPR